MNKSKTFMIVSIAALILVVIASTVTYAWFTWSTTSENETKIVTSMGAAKVFYDSGANITDAKIKPTGTKEDGIVKRITVSTNKDTVYKISFNLYLDIVSLDEGLKDVSFKYSLYKEGTETAVAEGNFSQTALTSNLVECTTNSTNHIVLVNDEAITRTESVYTLYIWIDGTMDNPETMQSKNFNFKLHADGQNAVLGVKENENLIEYINNLYTPNDTAENNGITYNLDTTHSLMNDRLGTDSVGADSGNIRYYGANPNNYIDIGDVYEEDFSIGNWEKLGGSGLFTQSSECYAFFDCKTNYENLDFPDAETCNAQLPTMIERIGVSSLSDICDVTTIPAGTPKVLYRIIGLFKDVELADGTKKDLIKVVRNEPIGNYSWDTSPSGVNNGIGVNEWSQADLMKMLNPNYSTNTGTICDFDPSSNSTSCTNVRTGLVNNSLWWNSGSGLCYGYKENGTVSCDFTSTGLNSEVHNRIEEVYWNLGGLDGIEEYPNQIYEYERLDNLVIPGTTCTGNLCNDSVTRKAKWKGHVALMYPSDYGYGTDLKLCQKIITGYRSEACYQNDWLYNNSYQWLLTPRSSDAINVLSVNDVGYVGNVRVHDAIGVSPVFYLDSALGIVTGDGSEGKPFVVR